MSRKLTIDRVRREFFEAGLELLSNNYQGVDIPLPFRCKKGHEHQICLTALRKGSRCTFCAGNHKLTLDYLQEQFSKAGYTLLEKNYKNNKQLLAFICNNGHRHKISYAKFRMGRRCPYCVDFKNRRCISLEEAQQEFLAVGYTPLFENYKGVHEPLLYLCDKNHKNTIRLTDLRKGSRCPSCVGGVRLPLDRVAEAFSKVGYTLLDKDYKNKDQLLLYRCDKGHKHRMCYSNLKAGNKCPTCSREQVGEKLKLSVEEVRERFLSIGYTPLFDKYEGSFTKVPFRCDKGHYHRIMPYTLLNGIRCRICSYAGISRAEKEIADYFRNLGVKSVQNSRKVIGPSEIDLFFPAQKLAVEYCGLYWHSEISGKKNRRYHYSKMMKCREKNIRLITVFEDEYLERPEVVLSRIENALGISKIKIYARNCSVKAIEKSEAEEFLEAYHLQGSSTMRVSFGLFYEGYLVAVITGGSLSRNCRYKKEIIELKRLCFLPGHSIIGGASKLFKVFVEYANSIGVKSVRSYQDMRYGDPFNSVYEKLGFSLIGETKYTPHYVKNGNRFRNQGLMKKKEERLTGKTEWELRQEQGYDRIWDCGHRTYEYEIIT